MQYLTKREFDLYVAVTAALAGAKANDLLDDGASLHHAIHETTMRQVEELRTNARAERLHRQRGTRR